MPVYMDREEEDRRKAELKEYDDLKNAEIAEDAYNDKQKRLEADSRIKRIGLTIIVIAFILMTVSWIMQH